MSLSPRGVGCEVGMARIALIIFTLLSMFLLNACGNNNLKAPANLDNNDSRKFRTGTSSAEGRIYVAPTLDAEGKPVYTAPKKVFENVRFDVNWDKQFVVISLELISSKADGVEIRTPLVYEGKFNTEGIAYIRPKSSTIKSLAGVRCVKWCNEVVADIRVRHEVKGVLISEEQHFVADSKAPDLATEGEDQDQPKEEIDPVSSGILAPGKPTTPATPAAPVEQRPAPKAPTPAAPTVPAGKVKPPVVTAPAEEEDLESEGEEEEAGIPVGLPSVITEEMLDAEGDIQLSQYQGTALFPINLGEKYPGVALGHVTRGTLVKGTDITTDGKKSVEKRIGFESYDRGDSRYYGSGLLHKTIEEAGKLYSKQFPGAFFKVNDTSKKSGGRISPHRSHQNGLEADISLTRLGNTFDYKKIWTLIKNFHQLGHLEIVFLNKVRIEEMCAYLKRSSERNYQEIFHTYMYPWSGHKTHMHVRLKCTNHNQGCLKSGYTASKYAVCK